MADRGIDLVREVDHLFHTFTPRLQSIPIKILTIHEWIVLGGRLLMEVMKSI